MRTLFYMHNMINDKKQLNIIIMLSEYTNLRDRSRELDLLLKLAQIFETFSLKYEMIHINITEQNVKETIVWKNIRRKPVRPRKPALLYLFIMGVLESLNLIKHIISNRNNYIIVALIATEYVPAMYLLPIYLISKLLFTVLGRGRSIFIYNFVDLYLYVYTYSPLEKRIYSYIEPILLKISDIILVASYLIDKYVRYRLSRIGMKSEKTILYFPPSVPIENLREICSEEVRSEIRKALGFSNEDILIIYIGNIVKALSGIDVVEKTLREINDKYPYLLDKIKFIFVFRVPSTARVLLTNFVKIAQDVGAYGKSVRIFVNVERETVFKLLCTSDFGLALLDPKSEATKQMDMPLKVAEYIAFGLPVIYTEFGRVNAFLRDGVHGFKVEYETTSFLEVLKHIYNLDRENLLRLKQEVHKIKNIADLGTYAQMIFEALLKKVSKELQN